MRKHLLRVYLKKFKVKENISVLRANMSNMNQANMSNMNQNNMQNMNQNIKLKR